MANGCRPPSASAKYRDSGPHRRACALGGPGQGGTVHPYPLRLDQQGRPHDKLPLAFDALALSKTLGRDVPAGKIIHGDDHAVLKVKTSSLLSEVRTLIEKTTALLSS